MMIKKNSVTYIGGPTVILDFGGLRIMTDPTLDPKGKSFMIGENLGYWKTEGPATTDIGKIDLVLLSHDQHGDNLDEAGRKLLPDVQHTYTTKVGADRLGGNAIGLDPWETIKLNEEVTITATPARHGPAGSEKITGDVIGFIVETKEMQIYLTGDTVFYEGVEEVAQKFNPKYVFIFAGAAKPRGPFSITMSTNDALDTASIFPDSTIIPVHFEGWSHYTESGEALQQSFTALGIANRLKLLPPGAAIDL
ncbi:MBL fold metallo-hydrolase [Mucilaginibacter daejeonensis]|uniref:MBL fold metallo-hydrolase n=1 Tax=Mucilaginibacter daejeonensis TaxID=398049 RepID=UPI001D172E9B|nr:MBL fold metallo-hydrolase [Mucilaginibacter daejeonensis]UEG54863.1 MBL fold metallo-hydrolase [Mucilaginibacter daejeonensis]